MKKTSKKIGLSLGIIFLICAIFLGMGGCKQVIIPDGIITVSNECGVAIDFFLDGEMMFSLDYEQTQSVENLLNKQYELEARRKGTGEFVAGDLVDVIFNRIFTWSVLTSADINIINNYGATLGLYGDGEYSGTIEDQADVILEHVPYGDHILEARTTEETVVATTTISVLVDITYVWTINK